MRQRISVIILLVIVIVMATGCGFVGSPGPQNMEPGFWLGVWHGLLAPWTILARLFLKIGMYEIPNTGIGYDAGFLIGITFSLPIGWLAALVAIGVHLLY